MDARVCRPYPFNASLLVTALARSVCWGNARVQVHGKEAARGHRPATWLQWHTRMATHCPVKTLTMSEPCHSRDRLRGSGEEGRCYAAGTPTWGDLPVAVVRGREREGQEKAGPGKGRAREEDAQCKGGADTWQRQQGMKRDECSRMSVGASRCPHSRVGPSVAPRRRKRRQHVAPWELPGRCRSYCWPPRRSWRRCCTARRSSWREAAGA